MKKSMLTALIALGFITPIITNTGASAAEFNQNEPNASAIIQKINQQQQKLPKLSEKQLKIQDSDIATWMPNPSLREAILGLLIQNGYLPEGSTVNDITKDLLASVDDDSIFDIDIDTFAGSEITPNIGEGLQYFNPEARVTMEISVADDSRAMQINFAQLHENVDRWDILVINPDKVGNSQLAQKIIDAKLPPKGNVKTLPSVYYLRANYTKNSNHIAPIFTESIDISNSLSPTINVTNDDFWKEIDQSLFLNSVVNSALIAKSNDYAILSPGSFFSLNQTSEGNFLGTLPDTEAIVDAMDRVNNDPQAYYTLLLQTNLYHDNQHQEILLGSSIYADFHK